MEGTATSEGEGKTVRGTGQERRVEGREVRGETGVRERRECVRGVGEGGGECSEEKREWL